VPNFTIADAARFDGDFTLAPVSEYAPTATEAAYQDVLGRVTEALANGEADDPTGNDPAFRVLAAERKRHRKAAAMELRGQAQDFVSGLLAPEIAADNALVIKGKHVGDLERIARSLFLIIEQVDQSSRKANDLLIAVAEDLPSPNDTPPPEKQALYVALSTALTVVKTVSQRIEDRAGRLWRRKAVAERERARAQRLLDQYVRKLAGIGRLGLQGPHTQLANLALAGMRAEFVAQEAGRIKNTYVRSLGMAAGIAAALCFTAYACIVNDIGLTHEFWTRHKVFLLAAGGAAIGTWLSFAIRRVTLNFDDLGILEEDLLDPSLRVIFVIALTAIVCLLFWTGAINIEIGNLKTAELRGTHGNVPIGAVAVLVGVFCGIAERALATAISGRAAAFVRGIAGGG
jgi:hypothetical protein